MHMPSLVEMLIIGLAVNQIIEIWRHSTLFQQTRYWLQVWQYEVAAWKPHPSNKIATFIPDLLLCNWCFSVWIALVVAIVYVWGNWIAWLLVVALAGSRIANLINDVAYDYLRTPKYDAGQTLTYPTKEELAEEWKQLRAETERRNRETEDESDETETPISETKTGLFDTPVSAKTNDKTTKPPPPPTSEYPGEGG